MTKSEFESKANELKKKIAAASDQISNILETDNLENDDTDTSADNYVEQLEDEVTEPQSDKITTNSMRVEPDSDIHMVDNKNTNTPIYCPYCGQKLIQGASFCGKCGQRIPQIR